MSTAAIRQRFGNLLVRTKDVFGCYRIARAVPYPNDCFAILMYHGVESDPRRREVNPLDIDALSCLQEIRFFERQGYVGVGPEQLTAGVNRLTDKGCARLLVTFDDGHENTFEFLKNLTYKYEIPVLVAV